MILEGTDLSSEEKVLLQDAGFLHQIVRGWWALMTPLGKTQLQNGDTTALQHFYWPFIREYCRASFGSAYCLAADVSLDLEIGDERAPKNLIIVTENSSNRNLTLPLGYSVTIYKDRTGFNAGIVGENGIQRMPLDLALVRIARTQSACESSVYLLGLRQCSIPRLVDRTLKEGNPDRGARIANGLALAGLDAEKYRQGMSNGGMIPTEGSLPEARYHWKPKSPHCDRITMLWHQMRKTVVEQFQIEPVMKVSPAGYLEYSRKANDILVQDAYHSLSIEGYQVTPAMIEKIASGLWNPDKDENDANQQNALAAKGYLNAFHRVQEGIKKIFDGEDAANVIETAVPEWRRELFLPMVQVGKLEKHDLAGFRNRPVFIRNSRHVPPTHEALPDAMETYFQLMKEEPYPKVQAVLGHYIFAYIHPYQDGNGRLSRFIMNTALASKGYPWTVIRVNDRQEYLESLEKAGTTQSIAPFCVFIQNSIQFAIDGRDKTGTGEDGAFANIIPSQTPVPPINRGGRAR